MGEFAGIKMFARTPCGQTAVFDKSSGIGYVCQECLTVVGSVSNPCNHLREKNGKF